MNHLVKTLLVIVVVALVICEAQVNFSPGWGTGKRSTGQDVPCKGSAESLMYIYKLVQVNIQQNVTLYYLRHLLVKLVNIQIYIHSIDNKILIFTTCFLIITKYKTLII